MAKQNFVIMGKLPSFNDYTRACRSHWSKGRNMKRDAESQIGWEIWRARLKPVKEPVNIHITWYEKNKRRDIDNITSATKFILDALVNRKILADDSQKYVKSISHTIEIDRKNPRIIVELEEVE